MIKNHLLEKYGQYRSDIFNKLDFPFQRGKKILDVGCGDGGDAEIFIKEFGLDTYGIDTYKHENIDKIPGLNFKRAGILEIPFDDQSFDYVFLHDVLHHVDEPEQKYSKHIEGLKELKRVCKKGGYILIIEANRYNPLFYPHMVLMRDHDHFKRTYFRKIISEVFGDTKFKNFEAHLYPKKFLKIFKMYERIMERVSFSKPFLAYNVAVIENRWEEGGGTPQGGEVTCIS